MRGHPVSVVQESQSECSVVERAHRIKYYKYFTYKNTYIYSDVLPKSVRAHNVKVNSATGMAPGESNGF